MDREVSLPSHTLEAKDKKGLRQVRKLIGQISDVIKKNDFSPSRLKMIRMAYEGLSSAEKPYFFNELLTNVETPKQEIERTLKKVLAPWIPLRIFTWPMGRRFLKNRSIFWGIDH